jgi:hypothetical protein
MKDKEKNINRINDLGETALEYSTLQYPSLESSASSSDSYEVDDSTTTIDYKKVMIQILRKQRVYDEKLTSINQRQNATDSFFMDEIDSLKKQVKDVTENRLKSKIEEIQILLQENIRVLTEIGELEDNWNQYGASKFEPELILKCIKFISKIDLDYQPEIFPSARQSVQIEFEPDENHYLEFEVFIDRIKVYKRIKTTKTFLENISESDAIAEIKEFRKEFTYS